MQNLKCFARQEKTSFPHKLLRKAGYLQVLFHGIQPCDNVSA